MQDPSQDKNVQGDLRRIERKQQTLDAKIEALSATTKGEKLRPSLDVNAANRFIATAISGDLTTEQRQAIKDMTVEVQDNFEKTNAKSKKKNKRHLLNPNASIVKKSVNNQKPSSMADMMW